MILFVVDKESKQVKIPATFDALIHTLKINKPVFRLNYRMGSPIIGQKSSIATLAPANCQSIL